MTETDIINAALMLVGERPIGSIDEDTPNARIMRARYPQLRDFMLALHPWAFATREAVLASAGDGWWYIPSDCLRIIPSLAERHVTMGGKIKFEGRSSTDAPTIQYVSRVTEVDEMDVLFREALAAKISVETCIMIAQDATRMQILEREYRTKMSEARFANSLKQSENYLLADEWERFRFNGSDTYRRIDA